MMAAWLRRLGLRLSPVFHPHDDEKRKRFKELRNALRLQEKALAAQGNELKKLGDRLLSVESTGDRTITHVEAALARSLRDMERWRDEIVRAQRQGHADISATVKGIRRSLSRKGAFTASVVERARQVPRQYFLEQQVLDRLARIAASGRPILAGPWTGEVGFELVYWAPFVRWFAGQFAIDRSRLIVVSRGGPESWYGGIADMYLDVFQYVDANGFAAATVDALKQKQVSAFDKRLLRQIAGDHDLKRMAVLHPRYMYVLFRRFLAGNAGVRHVLSHTAHARIESPGRTLIPQLPADYIAVKFYSSPSFPATRENVNFIRAVLDELGRHHALVLLSSPLHVDEHDDLTDHRYPDMASLGASVTLQNNLEIQTAVVAGARAFVGTYGGFSYLAPMCGVPAAVFYADHVFNLHHRYIADAVFANLQAPALTVMPTSLESLRPHALLSLLARPLP